MCRTIARCPLFLSETVTQNCTCASWSNTIYCAPCWCMAWQPFHWLVNWVFETNRMTSKKSWSYGMWHIFVGLGERGSVPPIKTKDTWLTGTTNLRHFATTPLNVFSKTAESLSSNCRRVCSVPRLMFKPDTNQLCGLQYIERIAAVQHCT